MSIRNKAVFTDAALAFIENMEASKIGTEEITMISELIANDRDPSPRGPEVRLGEVMQAYVAYMAYLAGRTGLMRELAKVWEAPDEEE